MTAILVVMVFGMGGIGVPQYARSFGYPSQQQCNVVKRRVLLNSKREVKVYCIPLIKQDEWAELEVKPVSKKGKEHV